MASATYNERSWAIDLIAFLQAITRGQHQTIRHIGGEQTISVDGGSMFPDVLLFGDRDAARILQGWELKLPDTPIDDDDFFDNAAQKASSLGLDSFILWNVSYARLYITDNATQKFLLHKEWDDLNDIQTRADVLRHRGRWEALGAEILRTMNALLASGEFEGRQFIEAYRSGGLTTLVLQNTQLLAQAIKFETQRSRSLRSQVDLWWSRNQQDYDGDDRYLVLARVNLVNWMGKFLFAHILRERDDRADIVTNIDERTSPIDALVVFSKITRDCNFWTVFCDTLALHVVPNEAWRQLCEFNRLLSDLRLGAIDQAQLSTVLETSSAVSDRKVRGQYTTPEPLAKLLVRLCVNDLNDRIFDPCCGSGTIVRGALDMKLYEGIDPASAASQIAGNDIDKLAVQMATFSLTSPLLMRQPLRLFSLDAFALRPETEVRYRDPTDGAEHTEKLGAFDAIASNLPFVAQEGRATYGEAIKVVNGMLTETGAAFPLRADIAAYLPFAFHDLLKPGGRMGIVITNAWLGTAWGETFYDRLKDFFELRTVITSGAGRWFSNSDVVTNILLLQKPINGSNPDHSTDFIVLKQPIDVLIDEGHSANVAAMIDLGTPLDDVLTVHRTSRENIERFRPMGLAGSAQFVNIDWVLDLPLLPVRRLFNVRRGERRGQNAFFYPSENHGIEPEYIAPVLKSSADIEGLVTSAATDAFSCSTPISQLESEGKTGALAWIRRFEVRKNGKNQPLPEALARSGMHWYEMRSDQLAEFVLPMGYGSRLYVGRLDPPAFVDQRLIALNAKPDTDTELMHALLNSTVGLLMIEAVGFGRGLGVLDLNKNRLEKYLHVLDPNVLNVGSRERIVAAFKPLIGRKILEVADELEQNDRIVFDDIILNEFRIAAARETIYDALRSLIEIRQSVHN